jgi:hypothetical protein
MPAGPRLFNEAVHAGPGHLAYVNAYDRKPAYDPGSDMATLRARTEHSTLTWLFEQMLEQAGFAIRDRRLCESRIYAEYTCVRRS